MKQITILIAFLCTISSTVNAIPYGNYDVHQVFNKVPEKHQIELNLKYLDQMTKDLDLHAEDYPPQFDCDSDKQRAIQDVKKLTDLLAILKNGEPDKLIMLRSAHLNGIAHNLDIPFAAVKADSIYRQLTTQYSNDAELSYFYGLFLATSNQSDRAIIFLNKALAGGIFNANRTLGALYLAKGDKEKALNYLRIYHSKTPEDSQTADVIHDIETDNVTYQHHQ